MRCDVALQLGLSILCAVGLNATANAQPHGASGLAERLAGHGYHPAVAARIAERHAAVGESTVRLAGERRVLPTEARDGWRFSYSGQLAHEPVSLYRGVDVERFDPARRVRFRSHPGYEFHWTGDSLSTMVVMKSLWRFTGARRPFEMAQRFGLVMEMQMPRFLLMSSDHPRFDSPGTVRLGEGYPVPLMALVPDLSPYMLRIGEVPFTRESYARSDSPTAPGLVQWQPPESAESYYDLGAYAESLRNPIGEVIADPAAWLGL